MSWSESEIKELSPILDQLGNDLEPVEGGNNLILCSAAGQIPFWLAERMKQGHILGVERDRGLLKKAQRMAQEQHLLHLIEFRETEKTHLPLPDNSFDRLISEFVIFPTTTPTEIGQSEMARVLKPGGKILITDVIITRPIPAEIRRELNQIGLDYLCEGTTDDFRRWMQAAGLVDIAIRDLTPIVKRVWEHRRKQDPAPGHRTAYSLLLEDSPARLGAGLYYIYIKATKPAL